MNAIEGTGGGAGQERAIRHASIALDSRLCTSCGKCAAECPGWCICLTSHTEPVPSQASGARQRMQQVLDTFTIDYGTCLSCGICIDQCPFLALTWDETLVASKCDRSDLIIDLT